MARVGHSDYEVKAKSIRGLVNESLNDLIKFWYSKRL